MSVVMASRTPSLPIIGWLLPLPRTSAWTIPILCPLNIKFLSFSVDDDVVPSFPPLQDSSGLLAPSVTSCPSPLSFLPICPLSARFCVFSRPPQCLIPPIVRPPSSVRRKATNPPASVDQCPLLFSRPSVPYAGLHPPPTCAAGGTWLGCG